MANDYFVAMYSTDETYVGQDVKKCLTDELNTIKDTMINDYAKDNHNHDGVYAPVDHVHQQEAISFYLGDSYYSVPSADTYTTIPLTTSVKAGTAFFVENNSIRIGAGINHVRVSAQVCVGGASAKVVSLAIFVNTTQTSRSQMRTYDANSPETINISSIVLSVTEGDILYLKYSGGKGDAIYGGGNLSYITVEKID